MEDRSSEHCDELCHSDDRERWLLLRREGIGASDAPAILGLSPFKSALSVFAEKKGFAPASIETPVMRLGSILEPIIAGEFALQTKREVRRSNRLLRSRAHPFMMATLDAEQFSSEHDGIGVLELKYTVHRRDDWRDGIPEHVMVQLQHQLAVTGAQWGSAAVLMGEVHWADVERNNVFIDEILLPAMEDFWKRIQEGRPINPDGSQSSRDALRALYPVLTKKTITLPGELIEVDRNYAEVKEAIYVLQKREALLKNEILAAMGDAGVGVLGNGITYTHTGSPRAGYTVEATTVRRLSRKEK